MPKVPFPVVYVDVKFVCQKGHLIVLFGVHFHIIEGLTHILTSKANLKVQLTFEHQKQI